MTPGQKTIRQWATIIGFPLVPATGEPAHGWQKGLAAVLCVSAARVSTVARGSARLPRHWPRILRAVGCDVPYTVAEEPRYRACAPYVAPKMGRPPVAREAAYRALAGRPMTIPELTKALGASRHEAWRVATDLVERGLVEKVTAAPPPFPLEDGDDGVTRG